ncbi:Rne/Rng family ribonuclease [Modestobacter sp. VKM Ac-2985]|uniref:Rne/Rng family ribonuclease n=1 Tax=Modestobacter sp. VKM Ac-2985 TaxID=3004139 RepID=UPI0022ABB285|nr:ribonuclease E/G [Modestobacter sp. VKM Ac-2985]MCZ2837014.1 Rne/Rng family ribonuclease [Modestobacter sp. VKM Ac-2985]
MADHDDNENSTDLGIAEGSTPPADLLGGPADPVESGGPLGGPDDEPTAEDLSEEPAEIPIAEAVTPQPEHELPRFGAQFSSPEPTTVTARPRRRATRPAVTADPDSVEPPAPQVTHVAPAFVSFVAPEPEVAAPRRRSRRPQAESPSESTEVDTGRTDERPATDERDAEQAPPRRSRSRRRTAAESEPIEAEDTGSTETEERDAEQAPPRRSRGRRRSAAESEPIETEDTETEDTETEDTETEDTETEEPDAEDSDDRDGEDGGSSGSRRRRRGRRGRGRGRTGEDATDGDRDDEDTDVETPAVADASDDSSERDGSERDGQDDDNEDDDAAEGGSGSSTRRRRRRRRRGSSGESGSDETAEDADDRPERAGRNGRTSSDDDVRGVAGSTRLEAKRQRRREGRDGGRRRAPILSESEFLARREAVDRAMVIRQQGERTQIAVLEDDVLVEHYVTQAQATSFAGNVYLGRVQNVLPSMEAAFVDVGKGRNAVLYAGEVNWDAAGLSGKSRSIETALKSGDKVLVQVTKDPIGHKGARLTQQVNLPGRFLVYVPGGSMTGISRKLPDKERQRLKDILKKIVPEDAGVIIRTAAEGASEEELTRDVARLQAQWEVIQTKASSTSNAPTLLYGEPDLAIRVIRDVFNEDFKRLVVQGDDAWDTVEAYVAHVSPELSERLQRYTGTGDVFRDLRIDEQLMKALDRKVWLPSGGSLVIDRTEAMTVVDVNTGKFVGSGGNLEQTVTRNNIEAAEEIVRQLRLRDIGGIIVIDFIDMVLESNRDLVLRRLTECLGRDRTKHQVAEVTSLGLVQMTRKRVGQGLLEVFSEPCEHCRGRGVLVHVDPVDDKKRSSGNGGAGNGAGNGGAGNGGGGRNRGDSGNGSGASGSGSGTASGSGRDKGRNDRAKDADVVTPEVEETAPATEQEATPTPAAEAPETDGTETGGGRGRRSRGGRDRGARDGGTKDRGPADTGAPDAAPQEEQGAAVTETPETVEGGTATSRREDPAAGWDVADAMALQGGASFDEPAVAEPDAEPEIEPVDEGLGRRSRGRRGRGQSPEARAAEDAPGTGTPGTGAPAAEEPTPDSVLAAVVAPPAEPEAAAPAEDRSEPTVVVAPQPVAEPAAAPEVPAARPRRRRAASRPAGPPA